MVMADHRRPARALAAIGGQQRGRIKLELPLRIGGDIGGTCGAFDPVGRPEQQAADFVHRRLRRHVQQPLDLRPCHPHRHRRMG